MPTGTLHATLLLLMALVSLPVPSASAAAAASDAHLQSTSLPPRSQ
eukprot:COSAG02_NODE_48807_length_331_cov_0.801724_1_plen_45_part_10